MGSTGLSDVSLSHHLSSEEATRERILHLLRILCSAHNLTISVLKKQQGSAYCTCSGFCAVCVPHIISPSQETPSAAQNFAFHCTMRSQMFSNVQFNIHHTNTAGCSLGIHFKARKFIQHMRSKCANCSGMLMALRRTEDPETIGYI